jgi:CHAT domain-containing protein
MRIKKNATIYPIILPDKLAVIFSLPGEEKLRMLPPQYISGKQLREKIHTLYKDLQEDGTQKNVKLLSQELYNLIMRDLKSYLVDSGVDTIAFVLDGPLRNIPMAALYDGKKYLVENYAIALTPSLQLINPKPLPTKLKVFIGGLSKAEGYPPLPQVEQEIEFITNIVDTRKSLLNQYFTKTAIEEAIKSASVNIIHLATHGTFSSKAEETYIVTFPESDDNDNNDNRITINELGEYINSRDTYKLPPIELLILSACKTAAGDERAALGLAGFAVRAGARSTLASLWKMDDEAGVLLIKHFYQELVNDPNISKAKALKNAQIKLWEDDLLYKTHPYYWASLVLVGNWL